MPSPRTQRALARLADLTPSRIVAELDRYIIGQGSAKKAVAIALRNRWRRQQTDESIRGEISPNNIILIGPTGCGKTEIARRVSKLASAPFVKVEASKFTEVGYVGRDVESMVRDLVENALDLVRSEREVDITAEATERVEDRLLDALLPAPVSAAPPSSPTAASGTPDGAAAAANPNIFLVGAAGAATTAPVSDADSERHQRTREKLRILLREGQLEARKVDLEVPVSSGPTFGMVNQPGAQEGMEQFTQMMQDLLPKRTKRRSMTVAEARRVLLQQELDRMLDRDEIIAEAIERTEETGIVFLDEIDKIAGQRGGANGPDVSREGVQRDLLPIVEGSTVQTKYGMVKTDHVLFIAAGAFHVSKPSDLIPELQGRFPIRVELLPLTEADFVRIMTEPEHALTRQYAALVTSEGATLTFAEDGIAELARVATVCNSRMENIGARRLHTVMTTLLEELLYGLPESGQATIVVDAPMVRARLEHVSQDEDLRRYIL
ncbi:MAG TPA: ATP-dependent protease ATPase subunit HslU [Gemmatimonadaceae bacterium]|nr:ATP-dependent protease ATPase subunit HslU [Gemmatimonadaceae bacterium]